MTSCPCSSDDSVTAHSAIHVAGFGAGPVKFVRWIAHFWLAVFSVLYDMVSPHFFFKLFAFISLLCRDSLACLLAGPVTSGEKQVLERIYILTSGTVRSSPGVSFSISVIQFMVNETL